MTLLENVKLMELPEYFAIMLSFLVIGILHFWSFILPIFGIQFLAVWYYPENIGLWASIFGYGASIWFSDSIMIRLEKSMQNVAPYTQSGLIRNDAKSH